MDALQLLDWEAVVADLNPPSCSEASSALNRAAREAKARGEAGRASALEFLAAVCRFRLDINTDDGANGPYTPAGVMGETRTALPEDLSDIELDALAMVAENPALPPDLTARFADVLFIRRKDYRAVPAIIDYYLKAAAALEATDAAPLTPSRLRRAVQLAVRFGGKKKKGGQVERVILEAERLLRARSSKARKRSGELIDILLEYRHPDLKAVAQLVEELAKEQEAEEDLFTAKGLWRRAGQAWQKAGKQEASRVAMIEAAECHVRIAEDSPNDLFRSSHLESALQAYRKIPDTEQRRKELHRLLLNSQGESVGQMGTISTPLDLSNAANSAVAEVEGLPWLEAIFTLALGVVNPDFPDAIEKQVIEMAQVSPLLTLIGASRVSHQGRIIAKKPDAFSDEEGALRAEMERHAAHARHLDVKGRIRPARIQILHDHGSRWSMFEALASESEFVPHGRTRAFGRALAAGMEGDLVVSTYLLPSLIEHAILVLLLRRRVIPSSISEEDAQRRYGLNTTLRDPLGEEIAASLGKDIHFVLRSLLVERFGANLRNAVAHGLLSAGGVYSTEAEYLWWLALRLCCASFQGELPPGFERHS